MVVLCYNILMKMFIYKYSRFVRDYDYMIALKELFSFLHTIWLIYLFSSWYRRVLCVFRGILCQFKICWNSQRWDSRAARRVVQKLPGVIVITARPLFCGNIRISSLIIIQRDKLRSLPLPQHRRMRENTFAERLPTFWPPENNAMILYMSTLSSYVDTLFHNQVI